MVRSLSRITSNNRLEGGIRLLHRRGELLRNFILGWGLWDKIRDIKGLKM